MDTTKVTLGGAWLIAIGAIALSDVVTIGSSRALLLGCGIIPVVMMWMFWTPPEATLSQSISRARR